MSSPLSAFLFLMSKQIPDVLCSLFRFPVLSALGLSVMVLLNIYCWTMPFFVSKIDFLCYLLLSTDFLLIPIFDCPIIDG